MISVVEQRPDKVLVQFEQGDSLYEILQTFARALPPGIRLCYLPVPDPQRDIYRERGYLGLIIDKDDRPEAAG